MEYTLRLEKIEALLETALPEFPGASWMDRSFPDSSPCVSPELLRSLTAPGWDLLNRGGKRWRPLLLNLVCETLGGGDEALPLVPLVELPHNASLIHDDIEDSSDTRRGKPAVHILYGIDTAINGGAFLYFLSLSCLDSWDAPAELKARVYALWGEHMRRLHQGQAMDIHWHRDFKSFPGVENYTLMCRLKTGVLPRLAALLGLYTGQRNVPIPEGLAERIGDGAEKLGVGFQIIDDVKNLRTGNPGKKRGDDIVEGKKSLPILLYMQKRKDAGELISRCFSAARSGGTEAAEVEELIAALEGSGVLGEAEERGLALIREAREVFSALPELPGGTEQARALLASFTDLLT
jgi:octaprenyl-diphosphate synthase